MSGEDIVNAELNVSTLCRHRLRFGFKRAIEHGWAGTRVRRALKKPNRSALRFKDQVISHGEMSLLRAQGLWIDPHNEWIFYYDL